ncbi:hypothetical protein PATA110616_22260 [Paenibacillus tarimensis]
MVKQPVLQLTLGLNIIQRIIVMAFRSRGSGLHLLQHGGKRLVTAHNAHRHSVDEQANHLFNAGYIGRSARHNRSEDDVTRPVIILKQNAPQGLDHRI